MAHFLPGHRRHSRRSRLVFADMGTKWGVGFEESTLSRIYSQREVGACWMLDLW